MNNSTTASSSQASGRLRRSTTSTRRQWTPEEELTLIDGLKELCANGWRADNGTFRHGYLVELERHMLKQHPISGLKAEPHVNSKIRMMKRHYGSISLLKSRSGLGFNYCDGTIIVDDPKVWDGFVKIDPNAKGMNSKKWPLFADWEEIFGKDRATGEFAEGPLDAVEEIRRSQDQDISNNTSLGFSIDIVDDEDEVNVGQEPNVSTGEAEYAHYGPSTFSGASQNANGGTQQAENARAGPSAFPGAFQGADGGTQQGQNQGTNTQTSSSKANEKEKCRKRKNPTEDDEKFLNSLMEIMKQFSENQNKKMVDLVDKLGDRDHCEIRDEVLAILKSPVFKVFTPAQQIKASIWLTDDIKRMQVFLSRSELDRQTMVSMIINGEL